MGQRGSPGVRKSSGRIVLTERCKVCGWPNDPEAKGCEGCGWNLVSNAPPHVDRFRRRKFDVRWLAAAGLAAAVGMTVLGIEAYIRSQADDKAIAEGVKRISEGDPDGAQEKFKEAVDLDGDNAEAWAHLALVEDQLGRCDAARMAAESAYQLSPTLPLADAALGRVKLSGDEDDVRDALTLLKVAAAADATIRGVLHDLARAYELLGKRDEAVQAYRDALRQDAEAVQARFSHLRLAKLLLYVPEKAAEAQRHLKSAEDMGAPLSEIRAAQGDLASQRKEYAAAVQAYDQALTLDPKNGWIHYHVARLRFTQLGDPEKAHVHIVAARELLPEEAEFLKIEGMILERLDRQDEAYASLEAAERRKPDDTETLRGLARIELRRNDLTKARSHLELALARYPDDRDTSMELARVCLALRDFDAGIALLKQAVERNDDDPQLHSQLADALLGSGEPARMSEAIPHLKRAIQIDPLLEAPRQRLVQELLRVHRHDEAAQALGELVAIRRDDLQLKLLLARLWVERTKPPRYGDAIHLCEQVLQKDPKNAEAAKLLGEAQLLKHREGQ